MPQLDPSTFASQLFWLAITFAVLYWMMARVALPRIGDVLQSRRSRVEQDLERAESLKQDAEAALAGYEAAMAEARSQARQAIAEAAQAGAAETTRRNEALTARVAEQTAAAEARIAEARDAALSDLQAVSTELAGDIATKLTGVAPEARAVRAAVADVAGHA